MHKVKSFLDGVFAGLTASAAYSSPARYQRSKGSTDLMRMRGDVMRVGQYFGVVMNREYGARANGQ
ncbi:MAG: hypothetical protein RL761_1217 [Pseudomonadota bacterium]|jgi:hypothetical protein